MTRSSLIALACVFAVPACTSTSTGVKGEDGCTPGELRCSGDDLQRCDDDGVAFEVHIECVPGTCVEGQATCPAVVDDSDSSGGAAGTAGVAGDAGGSGRTDGSGAPGGSAGSSGGTDAGPTSTGNAETTSGGAGGVGGVAGVGGAGGVGGVGGSGGSGGTTTTGGGAGGTTSGGAGGAGGSSGSPTTTGPLPFCDPDPCPSDRRCDEEADECVCDGCVIGDSCVAAGNENPDNSCEVCNPDESATGYTADVGASCGSSASECSDADTCDSEAVCQPNHVADRTECSDGYCEGGDCKVPVFDCIAPDPPVIDLDEVEILSASGAPPTPTGGTVQSGRYTPFRVEYYGDQPSTTSIYSFEFEGIFVQAGYQPYPPFGLGLEFAGIYSSVDDTLEFDLQRCDAQNIDIPTLAYSATVNGMFTFETYSNGTVAVISYLRE